MDSPRSPSAGDKPIIWTVSVSRLSALFRDITVEYDHLASIEPLHIGFDEAATYIRERLATEHCDVVIAAGSNAAWLKSRVSVPVVAARASGFDVLQALTRARKLAGNAPGAIGVVSYGALLPELAEFAAGFGLDLVQRSYVTQEDARAAVDELKALGVAVIVGAGSVTDLAEEAGLRAVFLYSAASIRQAFDDALELARLTRLEVDRSRGRNRTSSTPDKQRLRRGLNDLRGDSPAMQQLRQTVVLYARSPSTVLIEGETGSGKELVAQAIHRESPRRDANRPFVAVNCGAIAESLLESELFGHEDGAFTGARRGGHAGLFEAANGGTLFLDEIGEMPLGLQTRLLRVLEEREVMRVGGTRPVPIDVRVISATHCDLEARVRDGRFRADLFYRLAVLRLALPPLRARVQDIAPLLEWSLKGALAALDARPHPNLLAELKACTPLLTGYAWPGNVRELRNLTERLALFLAAEPLQALTPGFMLSVAPELARGAAPADAAAGPSRESAAAVLARFGGQRDLAADHLGISRTTLWRRLKAEG
jgi:propionate catabolism operon transcriptional regulator